MDREDLLRWLLARLAEVREGLIDRIVQGADPLDIGELRGVIRVMGMLEELLKSQEAD